MHGHTQHLDSTICSRLQEAERERDEREGGSSSNILADTVLELRPFQIVELQLRRQDSSTAADTPAL